MKWRVWPFSALSLLLRPSEFIVLRISSEDRFKSICKRTRKRDIVGESGAAKWWVKPRLFAKYILNFCNLLTWILSPNFQGKQRTDLWSVLSAHIVICNSPVHGNTLASAARSSVWAMCQISSLKEESTACLEHRVTFVTSLAISKLVSLKIAHTCLH